MLRELSCGARAAVDWRRRSDASEAVLGRLEALEADVRFLCTELGAEKLLWSSRFLELLREQQGLRQRVSPPWSPQLPLSLLVPPTLTARPSCRSACGRGTAATAPSCWGKRRTKVPVGARERAREVAAGDVAGGGGWGASGRGGGTCQLQAGLGQRAELQQWAAWGTHQLPPGHWEVRVLGKAPRPLQQSPPGAQLGTATLGRALAIASPLPLLLC